MNSDEYVYMCLCIDRYIYIHMICVYHFTGVVVQVDVV